jgi:hypothetical protein
MFPLLVECDRGKDSGFIASCIAGLELSVVLAHYKGDFKRTHFSPIHSDSVRRYP